MGTAMYKADVALTWNRTFPGHTESRREREWKCFTDGVAALGFLMLVKGADWFVDGASGSQSGSGSRSWWSD